MHAIRRDGMGGKENSAFPGWKAWSDSPPVTGDPDSSGKFFPSSYSLTSGGEHPATQEPVTKNPELGARYGGAQTFVTTQFANFLPTWLSKCKCLCETSWFF